MTGANWLSIVLGLLGFGLSISLTMLGIIFSFLKSRIDKNEEIIRDEIRELDRNVQERLRSLGHEDRDIRGTIDGLHKIVIQALTEIKRK